MNPSFHLDFTQTLKRSDLSRRQRIRNRGHSHRRTQRIGQHLSPLIKSGESNVFSAAAWLGHPRRRGLRRPYRFRREAPSDYEGVKSSHIGCGFGSYPQSRQQMAPSPPFTLPTLFKSLYFSLRRESSFYSTYWSCVLLIIPLLCSCVL